MTQLYDQFDVDVQRAERERRYVGHRVGQRPVVFVVQGDAERPLFPLEDDLSLGVEWAYRGRGPTALARALLADHLEVVPPILLAMAFRNRVVAELPWAGFELRASEIAAWLGRNLHGSLG